MSRIFISHSSQDNFEAIAVRDWLISEGWAGDDVFLDLHGIGAGARWKEALAKANERCEAVLFLVSPHALASNECYIELRMAEDMGKVILPAILPARVPEDEINIDDKRLEIHRDRQIVDASIEPREAAFTVEYDGHQRTVSFHGPTLARIKSRLEQLGIAPTSFPWHPADLDTATPYPGLEGFATGEAALFFGRAGDIARGFAALRKLRRAAISGGVGEILLVQAASGAGKSSFLKAGLWPRLDRDPDFIPVAILRPATGILTGEAGIGRQFSAFLARYDRGVPAADIHQRLQGDPDAAFSTLVDLLNWATAIGHETQRIANPDAPPPTPLIAVDQAEELFSSDDAEESRRFLQLLSRLLAPAGSAVADSLRLTTPPLIVWTLRADSLDALLHATERAGMRAPEPFLLPPIPREAYREIITQPLDVANAAGMRLSIDPLLTEALVDAAKGADALPLLAYTLRQLVEDNRAGPKAHLSLEAFEQGGGMGGVLRKRLAAAQRSANAGGNELRDLFVPYLATWDEDANSAGAKRLVANEGELFAGARGALKALGDALVRERLLTRSGDQTGSTTLEVAHEALLRQPPISDWLAEDREFLVWRGSVQRALSEFEAQRRGLLTGRELEIARRWLEGRGSDVPDAAQRFIADSIAADDARRRDEQERERKHKEAETQSADAKRKLWRTFVGLVVASLLVIVSAGAGYYAFTQSIEAQNERARAEAATETMANARKEALLQESKHLTDRANQAIKDGDVATGLLLALEALPDPSSHNTTKQARPPWRQAESTIMQALYDLREHTILRGHSSRVTSLAMSPDQTKLVSGSRDRTVRVWDLSTGDEMASLRLESPVLSLALAPDGKLLVAGLEDGTARIWNLVSQREVAKLEGHSEEVFGVAVTPDGKFAVTGSYDDSARVWDLATGSLVTTVEHSEDVNRVAVLADSQRFVTVSDDRLARVWNLADGKLVTELKGHEGPIGSVAVAAQGDVIFTGSRDNTVRVWNASTGEEVKVLRRSSTVTAIAANSDGSRIATTSSTARVQLSDVESEGQIMVLRGHEAQVVSVLLTPAGGQLVTGSDDGTIRVWKIAAERTLSGHSDWVRSVAVSPDGQKLATASNDGEARIWDVAAGRLLVTLKPHEDRVVSIAFTPDGSRVITGSDDYFVRVWDTATGQLLAKEKAHDDAVNSIAVTADGRRLVTGSNDNLAKVWELRKRQAPSGGGGGGGGGGESESGVAAQPKTVEPQGLKLIAELAGHEEGVLSVAVMDNGTRVVTGSADDTVRVWDVQTLSELARFRHEGDVTAVAVSEDEKFVISGSEDTTARLWDLASKQEALVLRGHEERVSAVAVTPVEKRILTASYDDTIRIWDRASGAELLVLRGHESDINSVAVAADGSFIASGSDDNTARIWRNLPLGDGASLIAQAKEATPRCLTPEALRRHHLQPVPEPWCTTRAKWPYGPVGAMLEGRRLMAVNRDEDARIILDAASTHDPSLSMQIDAIWSEAHMSRATAHIEAGNDLAAEREFDKAKARGTEAAAINEIWIKTHIGRGVSHLGWEMDDEAEKEFSLAVAKGADKARIDEAWANTHIERGASLLYGEDEDDKAAAQFDLAIAKGADAAQVDAAWAEALVERGRSRLNDENDAEAKVQFDLAIAKGADVTRINESWAEAYIERGKTLLNDNKDADAQAMFDRASAKGARSEQIDAAWAEAYYWRGSELLVEAKDAEAAAQFDLAIAKGTAATEIDAVWAGAYVERGKALLNDEKDADAAAQFDLAIAKGTARAEIDAVWAETFMERGKALLNDGKNAEAKAQFDLATAKGADTSIVNDTWAEALVERGIRLIIAGKPEDAEAPFQAAVARGHGSIVETLLSRSRDRSSEANQDRGTQQSTDIMKEARTIADRALAMARAQPSERSLVGQALMQRGMVAYWLEDYASAEANFDAAVPLGEREAHSWLWWAKHQIADRLHLKGRSSEALLSAWVNLLDARPEVRRDSSWDGIVTERVFSYALANVAADGRDGASAEPNACDRLASHPFDPLRVADGVAFESIKISEAIVECEKAAGENALQPRYKFLLGRVHSRAADIAFEADDKAKAKSDFAMALEALKEAAAGGYPVAFNNLASAYERGRHVEKDGERSQELYIERLNRYLHCCWHTAARHLLGTADDRERVRKVVGALTPWAVALGSDEAKALLDELTSNGVLQPAPAHPPAQFTEIPPWFKEE